MIFIYKKIIIPLIFFFYCSVLVQAQCISDDSLLKKISFLRDSTGLSVTKQIEILSVYDSGIVTCVKNHDSVYTLLVNRIGNLFTSSADFSKGIAYYKKSINLINKNAGKNTSLNLKYVIPCYYWLSVFYDSLHRIKDKMDALDSCAAIAIRLKSIDLFCLWALYNRAEYSFDIGDYHRCIGYASLCESLAADFAGKGSKNDADYGIRYAFSSLIWNVNALLLLKKNDDAQKLIEKKVEETKISGRLNNLGVLYALLVEVFTLKGDYGQALIYHDKAFAIEKRFGEPFNCKAMLNSLGYDVYFKHYKSLDKAFQYYNKALNYSVKDNENAVLNALESLSILNRIANIYVLKGKHDVGLKYIQLAFDQIKTGISETDLLNNPLDEFIRQRRVGYIATLIVDKAVAFHQKYKATGKLENIREAVRIYKVADQFLEKIKTEQSDLRSKLFWRSDRRRLYELAIEACHAYGNPADAFYFFERSRAALLYDEVSELRLMNNEDMIRQVQLKKRVILLDKELAQKDKTPDHSRMLQEEAMICRQELDQLNKQINDRTPFFYQSFSDADSVSLNNVQDDLLKAGDQLVEFFSGDSAVYVMIISPNQVLLERIDKDSFDYAVTNFISYLSNESLLNRNFREFINASGHLYKLIFKDHTLAPGRIIVSPDGHYFPVEALVTSERQPPAYLILEHPISYTHSARLLMFDFNTNIASGAKNFLGIAPVHFQSELNMPSLNGSDHSLQLLRKNFRNTNCLTFTDASKKKFMQEFPDYKIIQLYTHAAGNENAGEPQIYFADSLLHLSELLSEKKPFAKLIILSACETGIGEWYRGEGVFSFNRGFAALGIPSSVSNLWSVDNLSTYRLTEIFYKYLASGLPIDICLQKAKLEFMKNSPKEKSLPYYWAATVLAGKTDAIEIKKPFFSKSLLRLIVLSGFVFFFLCWLFIRLKKTHNRISGLKPNRFT